MAKASAKILTKITTKIPKFSGGQKCLPGVICIENMTLVVFAILLSIAAYFLYIHITHQPRHHHRNDNHHDKNQVVVVSPGQPYLAGISTRSDPMNDPYAPPLKTNMYFPPDSSDVRGIPINVETRGTGMSYQQIGILTRLSQTNDDMILPLMGRKLMSGRDKWQYYTISNTGSLNTKLPVSRNGKSCTNEYGCDDITNGDSVYVEGYNNTFRATVYDNSTFHYIPYL